MVVCELQSCAYPGKVARSLQCDGRCKKTFHIACVGVTGPHLKAHQENDGILWLCSDCRRNRGDAILEKIDANRTGLADLAKRMETYFDVLTSKLDTHSTMINELAATVATSNALNTELITRTSPNATFNFDDSFSAPHDRIRPSASKDRVNETGQCTENSVQKSSVSHGDVATRILRNSSPNPGVVRHTVSSGNASNPVNQSSNPNDDPGCSVTGQAGTLNDAAADHQSSVPVSNTNHINPIATNPVVVGGPPNLPAYPGYYYAPWTSMPSGLFCHPQHMAAALQPVQHPYFGVGHPLNDVKTAGPGNGRNTKRKRFNYRQPDENTTSHGTMAQRDPTTQLDRVVTYCVRNLAPDTTASQMQKYIASKGRIPESSIVCTSLAKRNRNISFQSFKVAVDRQFADIISSNDFWPAGVTVSVFEKLKPISLPTEI